MDSIWPTQNQKLLLKAVIFDGENALKAYEAWKKKSDINHLSDGETRLLPLLYHRLEVQDALSEKLKGLARHTWMVNQRMLHQFSPIFECLNREEISFTALKGLVLGFDVYQSLSTRPMNDVDILVPREKIEAAIKILEELGFKPTHPMRNGAGFFDYHHSMGFINEKKCIIDLHSYILEECCRDGMDHPFYQHTKKSRFENLEIRVPESTELLFHTIAHGVRWNPSSPIRWIADAAVIINHRTIVWERIIDYSKRYQLVVPIREGITYLQKTFDLPVPSNVIQTLKNLPVTKLDQREFLFHASSYNSLLPSIQHGFDHYRRCSKENFFAFCRGYWGLESFSELPLAFAKKVQRKM